MALKLFYNIRKVVIISSIAPPNMTQITAGLWVNSPAVVFLKNHLIINLSHIFLSIVILLKFDFDLI